jgi:secreted PhoX family phosphatase
MTASDRRHPRSRVATGAATARPALGSKAHEGQAFDSDGNYYGISESSPPSGGYIYKFVPDVPGDLSAGRLFALKITAPGPTPDTGGATWVLLSRKGVKMNADSVATLAGATGYNRPEDLVLSSGGTSVGSGPFAIVLYAAVTADNRVIGIDLKSLGNSAFVFDFVRAGVNAPADFEFPDNLVLDPGGALFITEDPGRAGTTGRGDDIWAAIAGATERDAASQVGRFASLTDCSAEPTGIYFNVTGTQLFVHAQHRGGDGLDKDVSIHR